MPLLQLPPGTGESWCCVNVLVVRVSVLWERRVKEIRYFEATSMITVRSGGHELESEDLPELPRGEPEVLA